MSQIRIQQILNFASNVIASPLTGFSSGAGTVSATDTILQGFNKVVGNQGLYALLGGATFTGAVVLAADPVTALGATTKQYVDNLISGIVITEAFVVSTTNLTLSGEQTIDGFTTSASIILVTGQTTATQNGIYITAAGAWARATEYSTGSQLVIASVLIKNGTVNGGTQWYNTNSSITIGSTSITFVKSSGGTYTNGSGITLTGNVFSIAASAITNAMLAGSITSSKLVSTDITSLGTITVGVWNGTAIANANLANSTISGVALGGTLAALTATNATLTFSGSYTGTAAQTVGLNLSNANTWAALQTFGTNISIGGVTASGATGTGAIVFGTTPTIATPVLNGTPTGTGVATAASASTLVLRDASANTTMNNLIESYTTVATAAGTTTLVVGSTYQWYFTGSSTQTVVMPVASTLVLGQSWLIVNNSTGLVTINSSGSNPILILAGGTSVTITCILTSGTSAASWSYSYLGLVAASGKSLTVSNLLTIAGTDNSTLNIGAGGTLGSNAFTSTAFFDPTHFIVREVATGAINGSNTAFVLAHTPVSGKESVFLNGELQTITSDYTIATATVTFVTAPFTGDTVLFSYIY